jgi:hypothetical protein
MRGLSSTAHDDEPAEFLSLPNCLDDMNGGRAAKEDREEYGCTERGAVDPAIIWIVAGWWECDQR